MRRNALRIFGLFFTLAALLPAVPPAHAFRMCPFCLPGYYCCVSEHSERCIPETKACG
jgi:hypothetical protein